MKNMPTDDLGFLLALVRFPKFGAIRLAKLRCFFPSMKAAFEAKKEELLAAQIDQKTVDLFLLERKKIFPEKELFLLERHGVTAVPFSDPSYPPLLKEIYDPPGILFVRGRLPSPQCPTLAVVGSRHPTNYGAQTITSLIEPLVRAGTTIVSGLAYGIDTLAHRAVLQAQGITVAVLGSGLDREHLFPSANYLLAKEILNNGGSLISEFPLGAPPLKQNFPLRNRIIAGLCQGVLVVEAASTSGSLITARAALEAGREVFAVPGSIFSENSKGTNQLIKMGAQIVTEEQDILLALGLEEKPPALLKIFSQKNLESFSPAEKEIISLLGNEPVHIDDLARKIGKKVSEISHLLILMEMHGHVRHLGDLNYILA